MAATHASGPCSPRRPIMNDTASALAAAATRTFSFDKLNCEREVRAQRYGGFVTSNTKDRRSESGPLAWVAAKLPALRDSSFILV